MCTFAVAYIIERSTPATCKEDTHKRAVANILYVDWGDAIFFYIYATAHVSLNITRL